MDNTKADVFIIESLTLPDEKKDHLEGQRIQRMLAMSDKKCKYFYIRTKEELPKIMKEFKKSRYRYLHLSCHANTTHIGTTLDPISFHELGRIINPYINKRRVFVSACSAAQMSLAATLMTTTTCYSVMGPRNKTFFGDAALFWASFYHVMFKKNDQYMLKEDIIKVGRATATLFGQRIKLFTKLNGKIQPHDLR